MDSGTLGAIATAYAAGLSTIVAVAAALRARGSGRTQLTAKAYVTWEPDGSTPGLILELVNRNSPRPVHVRDWGLDRQSGKLAEAGAIAAYDPSQPIIVLPGQSWSTVVSPLPEWVDPAKPLRAWVRLVTGEEVEARSVVVDREQPEPPSGRRAHPGRRCMPPPVPGGVVQPDRGQGGPSQEPRRSASPTGSRQ